VKACRRSTVIARLGVRGIAALTIVSCRSSMFEKIKTIPGAPGIGNGVMAEQRDNSGADSGRRSHDNREQLIANAVAAYVDLQLRGEAVDTDAYCRAYPELDPELRAQILALDELDTVLLPSRSPRVSNSLQGAELPERLSGHKILSEIGRGGMGRVLLALDERLGRKVAVKTLNPRYADNPKLRARFMSEARALARLSHPNVVRIYNLGGSGASLVLQSSRL